MTMRDEILSLKNKLATYVQQAIPQKKETNPRKIMSIYSVLLEIDNKLMGLEAQSFLDDDHDWSKYIKKYTLPEINEKLKKIDPDFF